MEETTQEQNIEKRLLKIKKRREKNKQNQEICEAEETIKKEMEEWKKQH